MKALRKKLSPAVVEGAKPEGAPYRIWDTTVPSLFLRVQPSGIKSFNVQWSRTSSRSLGKWPGCTVDAARSKAKEALVEVDQHGAPLAVIEAAKPLASAPLTFAKYIEDFYEAYARTNHGSRWEENVAAIRSLAHDILHRPLSSLNKEDFERIKSNRLAEGVSKATVNRDLSRLRGALSRAVEGGALDAHPMKPVRPLKGADDDRVRYLSADEEKRLRDALQAREEARRASRVSGTEWCEQRGGKGRPMWPADGFTDHLMPLVLVAINTGMRRGELLSLTWGNVNLDSKNVTVVAATAKSGKTRRIPLNAEALDVLKRWKKQRAGAGLVFAGQEGARMSTIKTSWQKLVADAELVDFRFHDLRHTFASHLVMAGVDLYVVMRLLGHASIEMTQRYAHLAPDHLSAAVAVLGNRSAVPHASRG